MESRPPDRIGAYTLDRELGRGGMGVVYLGHDTRLDRQVAIKVLPEHVATDPERLARFEREARTLASLSHPNIAGIYGVEEEAGNRYLVLEFVEGESLADVLDRGPLPVHDALELATQIAAGIEAAHEAGVVHRDLKPGNIMVTPEGVAKVLDFGLARFDEGSSTSSSGLENSPTLTSPLSSPTVPGVILGTAAYMSPEQARGRRVDKRSDIWSFGVVLYEMLVGLSPFRGETATDSIGAILHKEIDLGQLPADAPPHVRRVLQRCLMRDKRDRYRDIGDVRIELTSPLETAADSGGGARPGWLLPALAAVAVVALAGWAFTALRTGGESATGTTQDLRLSVPLPAGLELRGPLAISPDGSTVAFPATDQVGNISIYLRRLDDFEMRKVEGSRDGDLPAFSPDGQSLAFALRDELVRVPLTGGRPVGLAELGGCSGISWGEDGTIVYSEGVGSPLLRIPDTGAAPETLTVLADDPQAYAHVWPQHIPGTRKLLFTAWVGGDNGGARILDLDTGKFHPLAPEGNEDFTPPPRWAASGHLLLEAWDAGLEVLPFDPESGDRIARANARAVLEGVYHFGNWTRSQFALSPDGTLVYCPGIMGRRSLVMVDRSGNVEPILSQEDANARLTGTIIFSPDETRVLVGNGQVLEVDLERRLSRTAIDADGVDHTGIWTPDGTRMLFSSNREETWAIWSQGVAPGSRPELVLRETGGVWLKSVGPDGSILYSKNSTEGKTDLWMLDPSGETTPVVATRADENDGTISPDGNWVAFGSNATGRDEVYVLRLGAAAGPTQVSTTGGQAPVWSPSGTALYFRRERKVFRIGFDDGRLVGEPEMVFDAPNLLTGPCYAVTRDESHLVGIQLGDEAIPDEIRVVTNFFDDIRRVAGPGSR